MYDGIIALLEGCAAHQKLIKNREHQCINLICPNEKIARSVCNFLGNTSNDWISRSLRLRSYITI